MAKRSRTELKNIFTKGTIPVERDFHDLIDSMVNLRDEGLAGMTGGGLVIFEGPGHSLLEFFESPEAEGPDWYVRRKNGAGERGMDIGESVAERSLRGIKPKSRFFIQQGTGIGIENDEPQHSLDVAGDVAMENRVGTYATGTIPADGRWRNIIPSDQHSGPAGFFGLEVLAHTQSEKRKLHAVTHAICVAAYPKGTTGLRRLLGSSNTGGIQATSYYSSRRRQRIQFRWAGTVVQPRLEVRSRRRIKETDIAYRITSLFPKRK